MRDELIESIFQPKVGVDNDRSPKIGLLRESTYPPMLFELRRDKTEQNRER